jgi:DNA polymerase-3 subunit delta'
MSQFNWSVIGHQPIINYLQTVIQNNSFNHAYLFYGSDGLGKSLIANYFIKTIYCLADKNLPCDACLHCQQINNTIHPDIIYLTKAEDKKNITIEQVRQARSKIQHGTFLNSYKVILIPQANTLSLAASNALLKILEEPTQKTLFIFLTPTLKNIPATILSRVQTIKFMPVSFKDLEKYLINQGLNKTDAYALSHLAAGLPGQILPLLNHPKLLTEYKHDFQQLLTDISADLNSRFALVEKIAAQSNSESAKLNSKQFLQKLSSLLHDALLLKNMCFNRITHVALKQQLSALANKYSTLQLANLLAKIKTTYKYIDQNVNLRLAMENLMLEF